MPGPAGTKRVKGIGIYRPFVYGSVAKPFDTDNRPAGIDPDHTHQWTLFVRGVNGEDISYWLKKVQFKLHETYTNSLRTVESPPFEVTETGWGEFEVMIKLYFAPEANEKPQNQWHTLKLHPYGPNAEAQRENKEAIVSQVYEEIIFVEPTEPFFDIMTGGPLPQTPALGGPGTSGRGSKSGKSAKQQSHAGASGDRSAEIPFADSADNPYSQKAEGAELDRLAIAIKTVEEMLQAEQAKLAEKEKILAELKQESNGLVGVEKEKGKGKEVKGRK